MNKEVIYLNPENTCSNFNNQSEMIKTKVDQMDRSIKQNIRSHLGGENGKE